MYIKPFKVVPGSLHVPLLSSIRKQHSTHQWYSSTNCAASVRLTGRHATPQSQQGFETQFRPNCLVESHSNSQLLCLVVSFI